MTRSSNSCVRATFRCRNTVPRTPGREGSRVVLARAEKQPVVVLPGLGNSSADYKAFAELLAAEYDCDVEIAPVKRLDWGRNAAGLRDIRYWQGSLPPRPTVDWYLESISTAVQALKQKDHSRPVAVVSHSAGGWLGRVFMHAFGSEGIDRFISLGSPHMPPPKDVPGAIDQTRGILKYCDDTFPGCHEEGVKYVTVAGKFLEGVRWGDEGSLQQRIAGQGYKQVCGKAAVWGDGIVPVPAAHLPGATQLNLEGVYHSPLGATVGRTWYGDEEHIEKWVNHLVEP